jgi:hypothetical protein
MSLWFEEVEYFDDMNRVAAGTKALRNASASAVKIIICIYF